MYDNNFSIYNEYYNKINNNENNEKYKFKYPSPADFSNYYLYKTTKFRPHVLINDLPEQQSTKSSNHTLEDLKSENSKASERNKNYYQNLIDNSIKHYEKFNSLNKNKNSSVLEYPKLTLKNYLYNNYPIDLQKNIDQRILDKQSELIATKAILENQLLKNEEMFQIENEYCKKMQNINEDLLKKIKELNDKNNEISKQRKNLLKNYNKLEQQIHFTLNAIMKNKENEEENVIINEPVENINNTNTEILKSKAKIEESFETDLEIKEKRKKYKLIKEKIYELNMNHKPGKLDEIRKKKLQEQLKKEEEELKKMIEIKKQQKAFSKPIVKKEVITFEHDINKGNVVDLNDSKNIIDNKMSIIMNKDNNDSSDDFNNNNKKSSLTNTKIIINNTNNYDNNYDDINININDDNDNININDNNNDNNDSNIFSNSQIKNNVNYISNENSNNNNNNDYDDNFPDLDTKKVSINEKEEVLDNIINRINLFSAQIEDKKQIYTKETIKEINEIKKNKKKIKNLFYKIKENSDFSVEMEILPILIFEIVNSNYDLNINEQKLRLKSNYDENDFFLDLNDDYKNIIKKVIDHLRKMIIEDRCNIDIGTMFLCKAVCNFPIDENMLNTLYLVIEKILKNVSISLERERE